ncbi:beta-1,4-galactosyltransferase galt-1 isoform X3 [Hermetia illucens]|nr:beta-1,4-galactosyltransferase galt-1 isoform X3 [Hermetia illucens]XP_037903568.1 beta-1,4-galactosyltransferase galt-1 isoform X3 [Hermetia illucens]XP_037903569.1 beta-1,4-galactosyltransferase galt-1 isoform X3 [Hermetia illucens]
MNSYQKLAVLIKESSQWPNSTVNDKWQTLGDPSRRQQIYSAYFDDRPAILESYSFSEDNLPFGSVRIFAILTTKTKTKLYCNFIFATRQQIRIEALEFSPIHEHFNLPFSAYRITCPLTNSESNPVNELPKYVVLSCDDDPMTITNPVFVPVRYGNKSQSSSTTSRNLAVCVGPIHNSYAQARRIVEFIHMYQLMGAEKIYFYNLNATNSVQKVLDYFDGDGVVEVLNWNLHNYQFEKDVRYAGIFAALNDCVYRATFVDDFTYAAIVDLDEILVPLKHSNLTDFLKSFDSGNIHSFVFRVVFFHENDEIASAAEPADVRNKFLYTQSRTIRTSEPFPLYTRTKYIVKTRGVVEVGNHFAWRTLGPYKEHNVDPRDGLLFHYRDECLDLTCDAKKKSDTTLAKYGDALWKAVDETCSEIFQNGICPIE